MSSALGDLYDGRKALNNVATTDGYGAATTLSAPNSVRVTFEINNAAIIYQLGRGAPGREQWGTEVFLAPSLRSYDRTFDAVRIRSAAAGKPAQVTIETATASDLA